MTTPHSIATESRDWLVGHPTRTQMVSALWIGSIGLLIFGLQPIVLGALFSEHRVNLYELALTATAELIAVAIGSAFAAMVFSTDHLRGKSAILLIVLAILNYAMTFTATPRGILILRALAGLIEGAMVAVSMEFIARSRRAERIGGYFMVMQTVAQGILAAAFALWVVPTAGSGGAFIALALVYVASLALAAVLPREYGTLPKSHQTLDGVLSLRAILTLLTIFFFGMFIGTVWAFLEPLGALQGIDAETVGLMVSASLAAQFCGGAAASWIAARIDCRAAVLAVTLAAVATAAILGGHPSKGMFWGVVLAVGFIWLFAIPYQIQLAVEADLTLSTALLVPAAQLLGAALGPLGASFFIARDNVAPIPNFAMSAAIVSLVLLGLVTLALRRRPARP
jgi:MFS transporter, DHA1 family, inner membrane transport protein